MTTDTNTLSQPYEPATICHRCQTAQNWNGSSWCPTCGYYPSADTGSAAVPDETWMQNLSQTEHEPVDDEGDFLESLPAWCKVMAGGIVGILVFGLLIRMSFPAQYPRGTMALALLAGGLVCMIASHVVAVRQALAEDTRIRLVDAFISWLTVWQPTFRELPETRYRCCALAWGLATVVTATTVIGGINYSAPFQTELPLPERVRVKRGRRVDIGREAGKAFVQAATKGGTHEIYIDEIMGAEGMTNGPDGQLNMEQAVAALSAHGGISPEQMEDVKKQIQAIVAQTVKKSPLEAIIYGIVQTDGVATSFLFAGRIEGEYCHVAEIYADEMSPSNYRRITRRLSNKAQQHPAIPSRREDAAWVKPMMLCRIRYTKFNDDNTVAEPEFEKVLKEIVKGNRR